MIHLRQKNLVSSGDFVFVMTSTFFVVEAIWHLVSEIGEFAAKMGDFRSSFSILKTPQDSIDQPNAKDLRVDGGEIIFKNLQFCYENGGKIFDCLNLHIKAGEKVGLVGYSGAGKSTIILF